MATTKEIKNRIKSVKDTQKITNAMYLIASKKMRKAKSDLDRTRPYFNAVGNEIRRVFRVKEDVESHYFYPPRSAPDLLGPYAVLVITADKGLAGAYNQNVIKEAMRLMKKRDELGKGQDKPKLFVVGEYGRQYFLSHRIPIEQSFLYTAQNPTLDRAREITSILLDLYDSGEIVKVYIVYTDMKSAMQEVALFRRLLPFHRGDFQTDTVEEAVREPFEFKPSVAKVLDEVVPTYLTGFIYSALIDSFCSEQNARMMAMDTASSNAKELIADLTMQYNHVRQSAITQEITEISSGAQAMRKKKQKR
ncbi:MAG: ATP synthase F1 subunit gamma [Eubacterium sp.]|nr:ATP synthase F1 subunit gamma [Eubacterium sp.]